MVEPFADAVEVAAEHLLRAARGARGRRRRPPLGGNRPLGQRALFPEPVERGIRRLREPIREDLVEHAFGRPRGSRRVRHEPEVVVVARLDEREAALVQPVLAAVFADEEPAVPVHRVLDLDLRFPPLPAVIAP